MDRISSATNTMEEYLAARSRNPLGLLLHKAPRPLNLRFHKARALVDEIVYGLIAEQEASEGNTSNLLSMLKMAVQDGETETSDTQQRIRDHAITLIAAGHETTAHVLAWTWYLLSQHPQAEAKLHSELALVLGGRPPSADDLPSLEYAEQVLTEVMRLYPPSWANLRRARRDVETGGHTIPKGAYVLVSQYVTPSLEYAEQVLTEVMRLYPPSWANLRRARRDVETGGHTIPKGAYVLVSQYVTQRDPRWFSDPASFRPERWTPECRASLHRFAYFQFGGGPRQCVGESFARMEALLVLAGISQQWRLSMVPGHNVVPEPLITLRPKGGMPMTLHRRADSTSPQKGVDSA